MPAVVVVLDDDRDAVQQTSQCSRLPFGIPRGGLIKRFAVEDADRVQSRSTLVVRLNAGQIRCHQFLRGDGSSRERRLELRNGRLHEFKRLRRGLGARVRYETSAEQRECASEGACQANKEC
jgi:hypothetical protein